MAESRNSSPDSRDRLKSTIPMLDTSIEKTTEISLKHRYFRFIATWRGTATLGIVASGVTLSLNLIFLIWALIAKPKQDGFLIAYTGSSAECKRIDLGIKLVINTLSTLILVSSNHCCQFLCAPTRQDIDTYHARGQWLDIGIRSLRNFKAVRGWRMIVIVTLVATSAPIHLLYNSVQLVTFGVQDYVAITVDPSFARGLPWDLSRDLPHLNASQITALTEVARDLEHNVSQQGLTYFDARSCQTVYESQFQSRWGNLVVVSPTLNTTQVNGTAMTTIAALTHAWVASLGITGNYQWWNSSQYTELSDNVFHPSEGAELYSYAAVCALDDLDSCASQSAYTNVDVEACFIQETPEKSTLSLSIGFLVFTITANLIKALALLLVINKNAFTPLSTTGEAVASFMTRPDIYTAGIGPVSAREVRVGPTSPDRLAFSFNSNKKFRLHNAPARTRWWIGTLSLLVPFITGFVCLYWANAWPTIPAEGNVHTVFTGAKSFETPAVYKVSNSFTGTALAVNAIQIGLAWSYVAVNDLLTSMVASKEYQGYAASRQAVRVATPKGEQRDTYFLSLPYRYALPLIILWASLHWQLSIELEIVRVQVYNYNGTLDKERGYQGMMISSTWFTGIIVGVFLIFVGIVILGFLEFASGMPLTSSNSLIISAACHRGPEEGEESALLPLKYGVISGAINDGFECVGFSSRHVKPLVPGRKYSSYVNVQAKTAVEVEKELV